VNADPPAADHPSGGALPHPARVPLLFASLSFALHLATLTAYGWFRDELYYVVCARHLTWGYVDQPPLSLALLWLVTHTLGEQLWAIRLVAALAGAATIYLTGTLARRMGGGGFAQALACLAAVLAPAFLGTGHIYSMNVLDLLLWTLAVHALLTALESGLPRDWAVLGVVVGLGLLNKISMLWFGAGLAAGLLLTPHRRALLSPWPWLAAAVAAAIFLPHLAWQVRHGWPTLEFMHNATARKMVAVGALGFLRGQLLELGPGNLLVWLPGLAYALFHGEGRPYRVLAWIYLAVALLLMAGGRSRASYLAVAYPMLLALGGVAIERAAARRGWLKPVTLAVVTLLGAVAVPFAIPVLPVESFVRYQMALGMAPRTEERLALGSLPQYYADQHGWEQMVSKVAEAYARLTPAERARAVVFGQNYGEAAAVDVLGARLGLPHAISGHNSYWMWGPGDWDGSVLIIIGGDRPDNATFFDNVEIVGQTDAPYAMPYERGLDVSIGRRLKESPERIWPRLKLFI